MAGLTQTKQRCFVFISVHQLKSNLKGSWRVVKRSKYLLDNFFSNRKKINSNKQSQINELSKSIYNLSYNWDFKQKQLYKQNRQIRIHN